jgi:hypothetical protein
MELSCQHTVGPAGVQTGLGPGVRVPAQGGQSLDCPLPYTRFRGTGRLARLQTLPLFTGGSMTAASTAPADALARALTDALREALEDVPHADLDAESLAARLAPALAIRLATAAGRTGASVTGLARGLASGAAGQEGDTVEDRILAALRRYPGGRLPGVSPDALRNLTGLSQAVLGPAVSDLVQAGELVRDAWLVRLPLPDDLLGGSPPEARNGDSRQVAERRAIGDRRAVGERRLYDRRHLSDG